MNRYKWVKSRDQFFGLRRHFSKLLVASIQQQAGAKVKEYREKLTELNTIGFEKGWVCFG